MKNGTVLKALSDELNEYSSDHNTLDYYQQPLPSALDRRFDEAVKQFVSANAAARETCQSTLTPASRSLFGIYSHRAATRALRDNRQDLLHFGLVATVIANYVVPDNRRIEIGLAVHHHTAVKLGISPPDLFAAAAGYAADDLAAKLVAFGNRGDVTLKKYGWKEVYSPDGIQYKFDWN